MNMKCSLISNKILFSRNNELKNKVIKYLFLYIYNSLLHLTIENLNNIMFNHY